MTPRDHTSPIAERSALLRPMPDAAALAKIRILALDVDGVLTDGSILLDDHGVETKRFNVRDGQGIAAWHMMGREIAIITKRSGSALLHRCRELGITRIVQGTADKSAALDQLIVDTRATAAEIAYVGDDWPDIAVLSRVGFAATVPRADDHVRHASMFITSAPGGSGAVREVIEFLLTSQGLLDEAVRRVQVGAAKAT
jgi:3-deoxy-D-manno-octulosonate 8-phosphate phosphatase (KDO 8-P phosphatase)